MKSSDDMMATKNQLLQRHSLADAVVSKLQQQLSLGEYQPGEKLPSEPELMEQFGVGRSTIREAIRILANTGMVCVRQGSGTFVEEQKGISEPLSQRLKRAAAHDLDEVRQLLEMKIAEKAALHRSKKDIEKMKALLKKRDAAAKAGDTEETIHADIQFHIAIAAASRNDILADLYRAFAEHLTLHFRQLHQDTGAFIRTQQLHESLLQSIIDQDAEKAWYWSSKIVAH
ncbi:FadR/GntR family transcriptional regulator [Flavitalea sp. BT771]|uniref:FadR/GntR family transcriptional regulator n=1 Tax=Flavitalea sp. BT771 TaxID=3063329 RepID=UPI0026E42A04|nr:FadR/GntR family transcriptional regulator [Flavitalea sp. BT771]MDO6432477.1 FadR/GntR family transcriptional regulator [Flavitalea sp. BT771]MDV6221386.1 FadR/GntR family transcriptional regulator [Flavitalea sp. BT771]